MEHQYGRIFIICEVGLQPPQCNRRRKENPHFEESFWNRLQTNRIWGYFSYTSHSFPLFSLNEIPFVLICFNESSFYLLLFSARFNIWSDKPSHTGLMFAQMMEICSQRVVLTWMLRYLIRESQSLLKRFIAFIRVLFINSSHHLKMIFKMTSNVWNGVPMERWLAQLQMIQRQYCWTSGLKRCSIPDHR